MNMLRQEGWLCCIWQEMLGDRTVLWTDDKRVSRLEIEIAEEFSTNATLLSSLPLNWQGEIRFPSLNYLDAEHF